MNAEAGFEDGAPVLTVPHYHWGSCMVCHTPATPSQPLKRCSRCHSMFYCSAAHQKAHWKQHKRLCSYLSSAADAVGSELFFAAGEATDTEDDPKRNWSTFKLNAAMMADIILGDLEVWEKEMFLFPRACRVCHLAHVAEMYDCFNCLGVTYCSEQHRSQDQEHHASLCPELLYNMICDQYESSIGIPAPPIPHNLKLKYEPLHPNGWHQIQRDFKKTKMVEMTALPPTEQIRMRFLTDRLSGPMTLLYGMEKTSVRGGKTLPDVEELTIHIVGSNVVEMVGIIRWEYVLHQVPKCSRLHVIFIGPELAPEEPEGIIEELGACAECQDMGREMNYEIRRSLYKDYCESHDYTLPDLVAVFNCGFHENESNPGQETWKDSLPFLIQHCSVPLIFTSYCQSEAAKDLESMQKTGKNFDTVLCKEINPFQSYRPFRDHECDMNRDVFYTNQYLSIIKAS
ncbi:putative protein MSS51 homolog, mitochondrial [Tigriopus californicus]|uniref:putative protein MSS51 homolog, mitochondrial n=1 Tax=Tigriopus californicus TaxID=6832 RepID=UPI0027D9D7CE|nr:putative protein MSS51 homolog, mitochondrial [Tigriopus californicus]